MKNFEKDTQSTTQKLQILFDTFCKLQTELGVTFSLEATEDETLEAYRNAFKQKYLQQKFFEKAVEIFNFNNKPKIVPKNVYDKINGSSFNYLGVKIGGTELYRGARNIEHHANTLCDEVYHHGVGDVCSGLYASLSSGTALAYTNTTNNDLVLKLKLNDAKIIDDLSVTLDISAVFQGDTCLNTAHQTTLSEIKNFISSIDDDSHRAEFTFTLLNDLAIIAMFLGYDAMYDHNFPSIAIFNREKICVTENEFERICKLAGRTQKQPT